MDFTAILREARQDWTLYIVAGLFATATLVSLFRPAERKRIKTIAIFVLLHLVLVLVTGLVGGASAAPEAVKELRLATLAFGAMATVAMAGIVVFDLLFAGLRISVPRILRDVIGAVALAFAIFSIASRVGVNLSGLIATSAVLTAVIGFSLQDTLGNIMGGLAIQMDNSIKVGDWIKIGDINGRVADIRWRYTAIETRNWETLIVPNSIIMKGQVVVLGRRSNQPQQWRRWVWFNVDYRYPPNDVIDAVMKAILGAQIERVAKEPPPNCILMDFHESYCRYAVRYWLTDLAADDPTDSSIRTRIYAALQRASIPLSIPAHAIFLTEESAAREAEKAKREQDRRMQAIADVDLFNHIPDEERAHLAAGLRFAPFARGETLTKQGDEAHWLYMIVEGDVSVKVAIEGAAEREVARLGPGKFFGEMSLMTGAPRSASVYALTDVDCYRLEKGIFQEVVRRRPEMAEEIAGVLAARKVELEAVKEGLSEETKRRRMDAAKDRLLDSIRSFFGLEETVGV